MTFNDLNINTPLRNALQDLNLTEPTPIQAAAFPVLMSGRDAVGVAQTGTGKTFAYLLPILRQLSFSTQKAPRVLIVVPTRELVIQVVEEAQKLGKYMNHRIRGVYGGVNMNTQKDDLVDGMDILVATPGRLVDLTMSGAVKLKQIRQFIIDEMDEMLNLGFRPQLNMVMDLLPERRQNILFSATLTKEVETFILNVFADPIKIEIAASGSLASGLSQKLYLVPNFNTKINLLKHLLATETSWKKVLVFVSTKQMADDVFDILNEEFEGQIGVIHSNKSQNYRIRTVENFDNGTHRVLIATDLIARGLDFENITHVINVDTPEEAENYIHRVGRTARANAKGEAVTFVSEVDVSKEMEYLAAIETLIKQKLDIVPLPDEVEISDKLTEDEIVVYKQKNPARNYTPKNFDSAFHEKIGKNKKINLAQERRLARKKEKYEAKRHGKKP